MIFVFALVAAIVPDLLLKILPEFWRENISNFPKVFYFALSTNSCFRHYATEDLDSTIDGGIELMNLSS